MELSHISGSSYYIPGRVNLGLYRQGEEALMIDSGGDETSGRHIFRLLEKEQLGLSAIINTHSNADHVGGNAYLQKKTGCRIMSTETEGAIINNTFLEPLILWSAFPFRELQNKFLQAKPSRVTDIIENEGKINGTDLEAVPLPGHFIDMIGIRTPDGVFFIADSLFASHIIDKYHLMVTMDVRASLQTLDVLESSCDAFYVPCHAEPSDDIVPLVKKNRDNLFAIGDEVLDICSEPSSREDILSKIITRYNLALSPTQYVLDLATISAHIAFLSDEKKIEYVVSEGRLLWKKR
jgi:glyoxylase-like metal-dependent hydrolase (beta-lactamase superfamily II)